MATRIESDAEFDDKQFAIAGIQAVSRNSTGKYTYIALATGTTSLRVNEYRGGGPCIPSDPDRNPGYVIVQTAHEDGVDYLKETDMGTGGGSHDWEIDETPS